MLYVPKLKKRLVSISVITENGKEVVFRDDICSVLINQKKYVLGHKFGKLWRLNTVVSCSFSSADQKKLLSLWHYRFGHLNYNDVKQLSDKNMVNGLSYVNDVDRDICRGCAMGKQHRMPFPKKSNSKTTQQLELIHSDVCGPMHTESKGGSLYFLLFIDDFSRYSHIYFLKNKSEVYDKFVDFVTMAENLTNKKVKKIRSDNAEYTSNKFIEFCKKHGIARETSIPYTPEQNGVSERMNRSLVEMARSMLHHADIPLSFWAEAVSTACYLRNRSPTSTFKGETPHERWFGVKPDVEHLRVFGCRVYVHIPDKKRRKLDKKAFDGVFVGYPEGSKGYKIYNLESKKMVSSRDVTFVENSFNDVSHKKIREFVELGFEDDVVADDVVAEDNVEVDESSDRITDILVDVNSENKTSVEVFELTQPLEFFDYHEETQNEDPTDETPNRPMRTRKKPEWYGIANMVDVAAEYEPKTYKQAMRSQHAVRWKSAMQEEYESLMKHNTWTLVDLPEDRNLVGSRWVYKIKRNASGKIDRYKARLVAQGFTQEHGIDYEEIFAPVARYQSIRCVLAIANQYNFEVHQMDVKSAFLNGDLDDMIFMKQPEGFVDENNPDQVCRLNRSIYGLKQSARCWNIKIDNYLKSCKFIQSNADHCIYLKIEVKNGRKIIIIIAVYVDDTIICSNSIDDLNMVKNELSNQFEMDDRGEIHYLLGMRIIRDRERRILTIDQALYLEDVLRRFGMQDCKPMSTPLETGKRFQKLDDDADTVDVKEYQSIIGSLIYASIGTRPDISVSVGVLSQFMSRPSPEHLIGAKRILRYIKGTIQLGLKFEAVDDFRLVGYSDADWGGDIIDRRSLSGYIFRLGGASLSWRSKKQPVVALSSTEAEYIALCAAVQEAVWLRSLLKDLSFEQKDATTLFEDNQGAIVLSKNPNSHPRTKHIDIKYHYTREKVESGEITLRYCRTDEMLADIFTKGLTRFTFDSMRSKCGVHANIC